MNLFAELVLHVVLKSFINVLITFGVFEILRRNVFVGIGNNIFDERISSKVQEINVTIVATENNFTKID